MGQSIYQIAKCLNMSVGSLQRYVNQNEELKQIQEANEADKRSRKSQERESGLAKN